jgi:hypothetical protein
MTQQANQLVLIIYSPLIADKIKKEFMQRLCFQTMENATRSSY